MGNRTKHRAPDLPQGWVWTTIGEIATNINPGFAAGQHNQEGRGHPQLRPMNISAIGEIDLSEIKYVEATNYDHLMRGDVLFNNTNSPVWVGKTSCIRQDTDWAYSNHMTRIRLPEDQISAAWVAHSLHYLFLDGFFRMNCRHHVNQASISSGFLAEKVSIPLPPLPEQHRIVAEIEKQFTRLDAGVAALKRVQANLKRYRATVLKAACEGRLAPQDPADEPADRLLTRILAERRAKWEAGHPGKRYVEPAAPVTDGLPELPAGWCWATVEQTCERIVDCLHSTPTFTSTGRLCVDANCIEPGQIELERARYVADSTFEERNRRMIPREDDVIFSREGALLGVAVRVPPNLPFCLGQRMMIFRPGSAILGRFYESVLNSITIQSQYRPLITGTAAPHLNIGDIRVLAIPLPPLPEQHRIVAEAERRLSVVAALEATIAANLARAGRLRQAMLKRAFEGRLVAQDVSDTTAATTGREDGAPGTVGATGRSPLPR